MTPKRSLGILLCLFLVQIYLPAQDKLNIKFGKITPADFDLPKSNVIDSNANAIIIADIGSSSFKGNNKGWFSLFYTRHTRIKIVNKKAFDLATVSIGLYVKNENREKLDKNHIEEKFTMPAVKEGSVIEYTYTINSDFDFNLQPWTFQSIYYPCLWSEYQVKIPSLLVYAFLPQGYDSFYIKKSEIGHENYHIISPGDQSTIISTDHEYNISAGTNNFRWVMKDVPAFNFENYIFSARNYIDKIEFQMSKISNDGETYKNVMDDWPKAAEDLLQREDFGLPISEDKSWLNAEVSKITNNSNDELERAKKIYYYVKDNFTCKNQNAFYIETSLKNVLKKQSGNVGEINLCC